MYYQVSKNFLKKLPNACFGAVAVRGLDNTHDIPELEQMLAENVAACESYFTGKAQGNGGHPALPSGVYRPWHQPQQVPLLHRGPADPHRQGQGLPHINAAVDLGNAVSIKHRLPMGAQ